MAYAAPRRLRQACCDGGRFKRAQHRKSVPTCHPDLTLTAARHTRVAACEERFEASARDVDVLVLGGGIIGLACAREILRREPEVRVALLEAGPGLCAGATGAGQGCAVPAVSLPSHCRPSVVMVTLPVGARVERNVFLCVPTHAPARRYLWMAHRDPQDAALWELASRGQRLWAAEADRAHTSMRTNAGGATCGAQLGYTPTPSLLIARSGADAQALTQRVCTLAGSSVMAEVLSGEEASAVEPMLHMPEGGVALRVSSDAQLDAAAASAYLLAECEAIGAAGGRFAAHFGERVELLRMGKCSVRIAGVRTDSGNWTAACVFTIIIVLLIDILLLCCSQTEMPDCFSIQRHCTTAVPCAACDFAQSVCTFLTLEPHVAVHSYTLQRGAVLVHLT